MVGTLNLAVFFPLPKLQRCWLKSSQFCSRPCQILSDFFATLCTDACKFPFSFYKLQLRSVFFILKMNHFVYVVSRCRWHFPIESGSEAATYNRRVYELSCRHNTVSRYVGFLFLFNNIFNYKLSRVGKKVKIYLDITKLRWVCDETYLQDKGVPYPVLFTRLHFFI